MSAPVEHDPLVCLMLGSNIKPRHYIPRAIAELRARFDVVALSSAWESPPVGTDRGGDFLNVAVLIRSSLPVAALKAELRALETLLGRRRSRDKNAPRTVDIDILTRGEQVLDDDLWRLPHLAVPAAEVLPDLRHPQSGERLADVARRLRAEGDIWLAVRS